MRPSSVAAAIVVVLLALSVTLVAYRAVRRAMAKREVARLAPPGRAMGMVEQAFNLMHHMGAFVVVQIVRCDGSLDEATLRRALREVQARHPLLRVHVSGPDGLLRSEGTAEIPLRVLRASAEEEWKEVALREAHGPIPYGVLPLVRVTQIVENGTFTLLVTSNHAVYDGTSAVVFLHDVLIACSADSSHGAHPALAVLPEAPTLEQGLKGRVFPPKGKEKEPKPALLPRSKPAKLANRRSESSFTRTDSAIVRAVLQRCKEERTTFNGLLSAATLFALCAEFGADRELSLSSNVSVRHELSPKVSNDVIGCFVGGVTTSHSVAATDELWALARNVRDEIARATSDGRHLRRLGEPLRAIEKFVLRYVLPHANDGRLNAVNITNPGRFPLSPRYGSIAFREFYGVSSQHVIGSSLQVGAISLGDELFLSFTWASPSLSQEQAARIQATLLRTLSRAASAGPVPFSDTGA